MMVTKSKKIIFIDENIPLLADVLANCGDISRFNGRKLNKEQLIAADCEFLFIRSTTKANYSLLDGTNVKFVGTATSGFDNVDLHYTKDNNIFFTNAPGSNSNSVAEYVVYSILKWSRILKCPLKNKVIGIIGFGSIGKIVARYAKNMGLNVLINDPPLKDKGYQFPNEYKYSELTDICMNSDIITNHVPLEEKDYYPTVDLLNSHLIKMIKTDTLFIHASRGGIVNETSLLKRLLNKDIYAVVDVFKYEPLVNIELVQNSILSTPHIAGYSYDGKLKGTLAMAKAFQEYSGLNPNYELLNNELSSYKPLEKEKYEDYDFLWNLLSNSRKLEEDFTTFFNSMVLDEENRVKTFDLLRKSYPKRREVL